MTFEHSSVSNEFYTPPAIVEAARATVGGIDLDPASCEEANEEVKARQYFCAQALNFTWRVGRDLNLDLGSTLGFEGDVSRVFLNPPGGKVGKRSSAVVWWEKLCAEWLAGHVSEAVFICFNLEVLNTTQASPSPCLDFPICYFRQRPRFWPPGTPSELRGKSGHPKYSGCAVYVPPAPELDHPGGGGGRGPGVSRFEAAFRDLGRVVVPS